MIGGYIGGIGTVTYVENGTTAYVTVTEDADTLSSAAVLALKATLDSTEDADTLTSAGVLRIAATADVTEDADTLTALGIYFDDVLVTVLRPRVSNITLSRSSPYQITAMLGSADNITVSRTSPYQITSARPNYSVITA